MFRTPARRIAIAVGLLMVLLVAVLATRKSAADKLSESPLLGHAAPEIAGTPVLGGPPVSLSGLHGRWVVVNFFASWCVTCSIEHPELVKFSQRHEVTGDASVLGVLFEDDDLAAVRAFISKNGGDWPLLQDPDGQVALDYGVRGPPESYVIDPNGFVVSKIVGRVTADGLDALLRRAKERGV
jgi:cytochrome c biogenesis protein CcmG/thiol:disulfide interchange protein DsbE